MRLRYALHGIAAAAIVAIAAHDVACTPAQRAAIPAGERAVCVMLRAIDPRVEPYCATADELAPFVPELIAAAHAEPAPTATASPIVAFAMPAPKRPAPRRHCTQWTPVDAGADAGIADAGSEASR